MTRTLCLLFGLMVYTMRIWGQSSPLPAVYSQATIQLDAKHTLKDLARLGVEVDHGHMGHESFTTAFSAEELKRLADAGFTYSVLTPNLAADFERQVDEAATIRNGASGASGITSLEGCRELSAWRIPRNFKYGSMGGHLTYAEVLAELDSMRAKYPNLITSKAPTDRSRTVQGRPIWWVRISQQADVDDTTKPEALYTGLHHAREPVSMHQLIFFMWYMLENYGTDAEVTGLLNTSQLYFVPIVNPDGYVHNQQTNPRGGGMWRKNRRPNADGSFGVDLNRNYGYEWGADNIGSTGVPSFDTYRGPAPFSEPETRAIRNFADAHRFKICLNYHTFSNVLIYPYGYTNLSTEDSAMFKGLAKELSKENQHAYGNSVETLFYTANGTADDYLYTPTPNKNKIFSYSSEIGASFWPQRDQILPQILSCQHQNLATVRSLHAYVKFIDTTGLFLREGWGAQVTPQRIKYKLKRLGADLGNNSNIRLEFKPIGLGHSSLSTTIKTYILSQATQELTDSILVPEGGIGTPNGIRLAWEVLVDNDIFSQRDTIYHYDGIPQSLTSLHDACDALVGWTGNWLADSTQHAQGMASLSDSRGLYPTPAIDFLNNTVARQDPFDLSPTSWAAAELSFLTKYDIRPYFDAAALEVSHTPSSGWTSTCTNNNRLSSPRHNQAMGLALADERLPVWDGQQPTWSRERVDLQPYITNGTLPGMDLYLRFTLNAKPATFFGNTSAGHDGFYIDDIRVRYVERGVVTANKSSAQNSKALRYYPNPITHELTVEAQADAPIYLVDAMGKVVARVRPMPNSTVILNTSFVPPGVYFLRQGSFMGRVVKGE